MVWCAPTLLEKKNKSVSAIMILGKRNSILPPLLALLAGTSIQTQSSHMFIATRKFVIPACPKSWFVEECHRVIQSLYIISFSMFNSLGYTYIWPQSIILRKARQPNLHHSCA